MNPFKLKCLFGFHKFVIPTEADEDVLLCEICRKFGKFTDEGLNWWIIYEYDNEGHEIHHKDSDGFEEWRDPTTGCLTHTKWSDGLETWYDGKGNIIKTSK